jgi:hypothetical protein
MFKNCWGTPQMLVTGDDRWVQCTVQMLVTGDDRWVQCTVQMLVTGDDRWVQCTVQMLVTGDDRWVQCTVQMLVTGDDRWISVINHALTIHSYTIHIIMHHTMHCTRHTLHCTHHRDGHDTWGCIVEDYPSVLLSGELTGSCNPNPAKTAACAVSGEDMPVQVEYILTPY